jgi:hypothetical protein
MHVAKAHRHYIAYLTKLLEEESDKRERHDMMTLFEYNRARYEEESNRRIESERFSSQTGRTCHTILRREPMRFVSTSQGPQHVTVQSTLPSSQMDPISVREELGVIVHESQQSLSPYDAHQPTRLDEVKLKDVLNRVHLLQRRFTENKLGLKVPDPRNSAGSAQANIALDVCLAPDAKVTVSGPRIDIPVVDLLFSQGDPEADVPSMRKIEELKAAARVRDAFAYAETKWGKVCDMPRKRIGNAMVAPDDRPYDECLRLLPTYGSFLPRRPSSASF